VTYLKHRKKSNMKKQILPIIASIGFITSCGSKQSDDANLQSLSSSEMRPYIAVVKNARLTSACAASVRKISGVMIDQVLPTVGTISFQSSAFLSKKVARLPCVVSVEEEGIVEANSKPSSTSFIATVKESQDQDAYTTKCAAQIRRVHGAKIKNVLGITGIISFTGTTLAAENIKKLSCVLAVEEDQENNPLPSIRVGN
jgi:hypothetical protein